MDIYNVLANDHENVLRTFEEISDALDERRYNEAWINFEQAREDLVIHSKAEREVFYLPLKNLADQIGFELVSEAEEEHAIPRS